MWHASFLLAGLAAVQALASPARAGGMAAAVVANPAPDSLRLSLEAPDSVPAGRAVSLTFRIENISDRTLDLNLRGRTIAFDVIVRGTDGGVVWRRLENEVVPAIIRLETLRPGGMLELGATWDQRSYAGRQVAPGPYVVEAELLTDAEPLRTRGVTVEISGD